MCVCVCVRVFVCARALEHAHVRVMHLHARLRVCVCLSLPACACACACTCACAFVHVQGELQARDHGIAALKQELARQRAREMEASETTEHMFCLEREALFSRLYFLEVGARV